LVHSINATASAFEMEPVAQRQARRRAVLALDLPGFGLSDKSSPHHTPQLMREAVDAALDWIGRQISPRPVDVMALSLGCEFVTEAVLGHPGRVRTLALISPTGMEGKRRDERYENGRTREVAWLRRMLQAGPVGALLYRVLTTRPVMRRFLASSWGTAGFDQRLLFQGRVCAARPGARHAPLDFVSGGLFTRGIIERYRALPVPVWVVHGNRGSFTDFDACPVPVGGHAGLVARTLIEGGAMPHFQSAEAFDTAYQDFLGGMRPRAEPEPPAGTVRARQAELTAELSYGR
jgi:pimeloyl-ACP methyl ester carboxylesterase